MSTLIIIIHVVVAVALILIVLLQTGKGADMGAAFGGGSSQTLFGTGGASTFLSRLTTGAAIVFMLTSLGLAYITSHRASKSIVSEMPAPATQQSETALPATPMQTEETASEEAAKETTALPATEGAGAPQPAAPSPEGGGGTDKAAKPSEGEG